MHNININKPSSYWDIPYQNTPHIVPIMPGGLSQLGWTHFAHGPFGLDSNPTVHSQGGEYVIDLDIVKYKYIQYIYIYVCVCTSCLRPPENIIICVYKFIYIYIIKYIHLSSIYLLTCAYLYICIYVYISIP